MWRCVLGVNQVSLFFHPPRWRQRLTPDPSVMTDEGKPVQIADSVPSGAEDGAVVSSKDLEEWLREQGFGVATWGAGSIFERGHVRSMFGGEQEIRIHVGTDKREVVELYCRFTLPIRSLPPLADWARFVTSLCGRFGLRLSPDGTSTCSEAEFLAAVRADRNYQDLFGDH